MEPSLHEKLNRSWILSVSSWEGGDGFSLLILLLREEAAILPPKCSFTI